MGGDPKSLRVSDTPHIIHQKLSEISFTSHCYADRVSLDSISPLVHICPTIQAMLQYCNEVYVATNIDLAKKGGDPSNDLAPVAFEGGGLPRQAH
jgi:hypothetical protein